MNLSTLLLIYLTGLTINPNIKASGGYSEIRTNSVELNRPYVSVGYDTYVTDKFSFDVNFKYRASTVIAESSLTIFKEENILVKAGPNISTDSRLNAEPKLGFQVGLEYGLTKNSALEVMYQENSIEGIPDKQQSFNVGLVVRF